MMDVSLTLRVMIMHHRVVWRVNIMHAAKGTPMPANQETDVLRELRLLRSVLFVLLVLGFCALCIQITKMVFPGPAPNWRELDGIRDEVRQLREEIRLHRPAPPPPVAIPVVPPVGKGGAPGQ